jgi:putative peptidoglycan lipid II flippase
MARVLGATSETDSYYLALAFPALAYAIFIGALRSAAVPALAAVDAQETDSRLSRSSSELVTSVVVVATLLTAIVTLAAEAAAPSFADHGSIGSLRTMLVELAPYAVFGAFTAALTSVLSVRGIFAAPVAVLAFEPVAKLFLVIAVGHAIGAQSLVIGNLVGAAAAAVVLWCVARKRGLRIKPVWAPKSRFVRETARLSAPVLLSMGVLQVNPVVDRAMASGLGAGSVTALELGLRLFLAPAALLTGLMIAPVTATWSARFAADGWPSLQASMTRAIRALVVVVPALCVLGVMLRTEIVGLLFSGGAYPAHALEDTGAVFGMVVLGLPAQTLVVVFSTLFVIRRDTVFPMKIAIANVVINLALNLVLREVLGVAGIALSTTITYSVLVTVYAVVAYRRWGAYFLGSVRRELLQVGVAALAVGGVTAATLQLVTPTSRIEDAVVISAVGAAAIAIQMALRAVWRNDRYPAAVARFAR